MIDIEGLTFRYAHAPQAAILDLSLHIRGGSLFGLLGPNGSGKTTLISILTGLLAPTSGQVRVDSHALPAQARAVQVFSALVPQEYAFYPQLSVVQNLRCFAGVLGIAATERRKRLHAALTIAGLNDFAKRRAERLSGGLKRRLNLAIGLLNRPRLLLLDEPTVGVDPQSRHFILETIKQLNVQGTTVVYTTHYMEEVETLCDEIGVLDQGRLLAHGTLAELLSQGDARSLIISLDSEPTAQQRTTMNGIHGLKITANELQLAACSQEHLQQLLSLLTAHRMRVARMRYGYGNLEELFLQLTGRQLRD